MEPAFELISHSFSAYVPTWNRYISFESKQINEIFSIYFYRCKFLGRNNYYLILRFSHLDFIYQTD